MGVTPPDARARSHRHRMRPSKRRLLFFSRRRRRPSLSRRRLPESDRANPIPNPIRSPIRLPTRRRASSCALRARRRPLHLPPTSSAPSSPSPSAGEVGEFVSSRCPTRWSPAASQSTPGGKSCWPLGVNLGRGAPAVLALHRHPGEERLEEAARLGHGVRGPPLAISGRPRLATGSTLRRGWCRRGRYRQPPGRVRSVPRGRLCRRRRGRRRRPPRDRRRG